MMTTPPLPEFQTADAAVAEQLRAIELVTDARLSHLDVDDLLLELLDRVASLMAVDTVAVLLLDVTSHQLVARAAWGVEEEVRQGVRVPVGHGFAGRIAATRQPVVLDHVDPTTVANPLLWEKGIRTMLGVPLISGDEVLGVLHVGSLTDRHFTEADAELLAHVARRVAGAVQARQLEVERAAARVVQRSLLPGRLPRLPEIEFATRYVPTEIGGVGGDWHDAFLLENGNLWVMVGDVVGHGIQAAVVMGRLRSTLRAYALEDIPPEEVLARADRKLQIFEPGETATVMCALLRPPYDEIRVSLAGHPPPVIADGASAAKLMDIVPGLPFGVDLDMPRPAVTVRLEPGAVVVAYTDGLVERRTRSLDEGFAMLTRAVEPDLPEKVCFDVMDALIGREPPQDDVAVLVLRRTRD
ncbi:MAG TPA: GAF domain-containing SpoIIE family protein phosphatase [Acidimicrobiales bacterium]|nr:GAF domain-containing SpoIIE family protein phosphatase [Acidimicrobiales bacterium]